jgi:hypothetical protein
MLIAHVERYILLRQTLGYNLRDKAGNLRAFANFAADRGNTHVCVSTAMEWAAGAPSAYARHIRLRDVAHLARFFTVKIRLTRSLPICSTCPSVGLCPTFMHRRRLCSSSGRPGVSVSHTRFDGKFMQRCLD